MLSRSSLAAALTIACGCATLGARGPSADLVGTLWWLTPTDAAMPLPEWREDFDNLQSLGMNIIVFNGPYVGQDLEAGAADPLVPILEEAGRRGIKCYLDTLSAPNWWTLDGPAPEIERARARIALLMERYGALVAFHGFYIPYETYMNWGGQAELTRALYVEISRACHAADPSRPVMISPFFILDSRGYLGDFRWATPDEYAAYWEAILRDAEINIVALQDSGEHLSCYSMDERRPFFDAMKRACDAADVDLWANVETGELAVASLEDYVARFGLKTHVNDPVTQPFWRGVPAERLAAKLALAGEYTPTAITWGYREYVRPRLGSVAAQLYEDYCTMLEKR